MMGVRKKSAGRKATLIKRAGSPEARPRVSNKGNKESEALAGREEAGQHAPEKKAGGKQVNGGWQALNKAGHAKTQPQAEPKAHCHEPKPKRRHIRLKEYVEMSGFSIPSETLVRRVFQAVTLLVFLASLYIVYCFATDVSLSLTYTLVILITLWTIGFALLSIVFWLFIYVTFDILIFRRRMGIEKVLPDFLQLSAANIRAGMPIDRALWYAVRPRFGVLAHEIETVAKETMTSEDLDKALMNFASKYDSVLLKRSISIIIEGIKAGGDIGDLLNKVAKNIQEIQLMKREMSASVATYAIFITFSTVAASPLLFALSAQLLDVITKIMGSIDLTDVDKGAMLLTFSKVGITQSDFRIFAFMCLTITSFFSAIIISNIRHGDTRAGVKTIPVFIILTIAFFLIESYFFRLLFGGLL
ncbi:hypothetical protein COT48_04405 [Candidatus Woesearchaeota archaeon CG08_land_8_20_14_0_20_47_9]|nr:MAG: hypothetical protein AUJ69_03700 [Candidatus Woesearchaeota archaeon CG1_02_47_18]PIO03550.1 MAG: hypothetical protein COT48_04405 [Candidatus Woesearchaeota archaeon CG08_land_8_20_14_0_20_47_9]HII29548.1 type II secretion system F family protein [Candidatus Woesearchaeota archaeon]